MGSLSAGLGDRALGRPATSFGVAIGEPSEDPRNDGVRWRSACHWLLKAALSYPLQQPSVLDGSGPGLPEPAAIRVANVARPGPGRASWMS